MIKLALHLIKQPVLYTICMFCLTNMPFLSAQSAPAEADTPAFTESEINREYQERIKKDRIGGVYIPKNLDDAITELDKKIEPASRLKIKALPEDSVCAVLHFRLGQWMISGWSFYEGSRISHYLKSAGVTYPDDMADFLLIAYQRKLNGIPVNIRDLATEFKNKRKREHQDRIKNGTVISETVRKRN